MAPTAITIPFNRASVLGREIEYVQQAIANGHISGDGPFSKRVHALFEKELGIPRALLTTSCTHALEMTALLAGITPGDEVLLPSFTFVSTVNAFALRGARPVFVDVRRDTLNMDESLLDGLSTARTRAVVPVHYAGVACDMDAILAFGARRKVTVIEDNAHGLFARYKGRVLGTMGALGTQSFHETKNFTCGEGGALLVNDPALAERAEILREKGTNRARFFRGEVDKYTWVDVGSSYLPSDMLAAFLLAQLEERDRVLAQRKRLWERYRRELGAWAERVGAQLPVIPDGCESSYHLFHMILPTPEARAALIAHMRQAGILAIFHYVPLHLSPMGQRFGGKPGDCPVTEWAADRLVRLPLFFGLSDDEQTRVIERVVSFA